MTIIINTPTSFKAAWAFIKGFLDEKQRSKIIIVGSKYHDKLFKVIDPSQVPNFLGGKCELPFIQGDMTAPWQDYELVDGPNLSRDQIGVRHKKTGELFTPPMMMALKNPNVPGPGISGTQGAMVLQANGTYIPNNNVKVDDPATLLNRDMDISQQNADDFGDDLEKDEEEKQPDTEDPNFVNNMIKQQQEDELNQIAEKKNQEAKNMDI